MGMKKGQYYIREQTTEIDLSDWGLSTSIPRPPFAWTVCVVSGRPGDQMQGGYVHGEAFTEWEARIEAQREGGTEEIGAPT